MLRHADLNVSQVFPLEFILGCTVVYLYKIQFALVMRSDS